MRWLRRIALGLGASIVGLFVFGLAARFGDGPVGPFPGGELSSGAWAEAPPDWSALADEWEVELQLLTPPRSRTTWIVVHEGEAYVPCGLPNARWFKQWPHEAEADGRAVLRSRGVRHAVELERVEDPELFAALAAAGAEKYPGGGGEPDPDLLWYFRLDPRSAP